MGKQINCEYKNKEYTLEYTRESVKQMEREGFKAEDILNKPMLTLPKLFAGAFKAHHKFDTKQKTIDEMYAEPMETLMDDDNIDEGNAIAWDASF